jgi:hypothetical protein
LQLSKLVYDFHKFLKKLWFLRQKLRTIGTETGFSINIGHLAVLDFVQIFQYTDFSYHIRTGETPDFTQNFVNLIVTHDLWKKIDIESHGNFLSAVFIVFGLAASPSICYSKIQTELQMNWFLVIC